MTDANADTHTGSTKDPELPVRRELHRAGKVVFYQGDSSEDDRAYFVESGRIRLVRQIDDTGREEFLAHVGPGEVFGELALLDSAPRSATAICDEETALLSIARDYVHNVLRRADPVLPYMMTTLTQRLRESQSGRQQPTVEALRREGRGDTERAAVESRLAWIKELDAILEEDRVQPVYQPVVNMNTGRTAGFEALLRVRGRDGTLHPPMEYVELAEEVGATGALARRMLSQVCRDAAAWGDDAPFVAVNISQRDLEGETILNDVDKALRDNDLSPTRLELEVTESALSADFDAARRYLDAFRDMGVAVAIDDFGTGYASLAALAALPVSKMKIDKTFVWSYGEDRTSTAIVDAVLGLAHSLGVRTTAEGVETRDQLGALRRLGCTSGQGFLFAKGQPAETAVNLIDHVWFDPAST